MSLWIKICGNTTLEDARLAAKAGADAVGFVFAPSPRQVTAAQVAAIAPHLPPAVEKIGVFVDATLDEIESTVRACGLTGVQLHFDAAPELPAQLRQRLGPQIKILRVIHFGAQQAFERIGIVSGHDFSRAASRTKSTGALAPEAYARDPNVDAVLVDSHSATAAGGTGIAFDWGAASEILFRNPEARERLIVAGGLSPSNVAEAITTLHPWGVDVVSGVESAPGRKHPDKVHAFIANARAASRE